MWRSTARFVIPRLEAIEPLLRPLGDQGEDLELARRQPRQLRVVPLACGDELVDDPASRRASGPRPRSRSARLSSLVVVQPLLEQVRAAIRARN